MKNGPLCLKPGACGASDDPRTAGCLSCLAKERMRKKFAHLPPIERPHCLQPAACKASGKRDRPHCQYCANLVHNRSPEMRASTSRSMTPERRAQMAALISANCHTPEIIAKRAKTARRRHMARMMAYGIPAEHYEMWRFLRKKQHMTEDLAASTILADIRAKAERQARLDSDPQHRAARIAASHERLKRGPGVNVYARG